MEMFLPLHRIWAYRVFTRRVMQEVAAARASVPVLIGEWCISTRHAGFLRNHRYEGKGTDIYGIRIRSGKAGRLWQDVKRPFLETRARRYREIAAMELSAWERCAAGHIYWSYKLYGDRAMKSGESWKESWDFRRCIRNGWIPSYRSLAERGGKAVSRSKLTCKWGRF